MVVFGICVGCGRLRRTKNMVRIRVRISKEKAELAEWVKSKILEVTTEIWIWVTFCVDCQKNPDAIDMKRVRAAVRKEGVVAKEELILDWGMARKISGGVSINPFRKLKGN